MVIELDSEVAIDLLMTRNIQGHTLQQLLQGIMDIGREVERFNWKKMDRDQNSLADIMAKQSLSLNSGSNIYDAIGLLIQVSSFQFGFSWASWI